MENIKRIRTSKKITLKNLSDKSGVAIGYISDIENGKALNPSYNTLTKISNGLGVKVSDLIT